MMISENITSLLQRIYCVKKWIIEFVNISYGKLPYIGNKVSEKLAIATSQLGEFLKYMILD